jgi:site-specific DNA-cytosine methylase/intein/homing endonuclease
MEGGEVLVKDIICVSLFNGMGCSFQAIDRVPGLRCVQKISSEIDKYANIVNDANYPETIQLGSVTDIEVLKEDGVAIGLKGGNGVEVMFEKGVDILFVGGSPCFVKGTSIITKGLVKNIEDVKVGDMVLTHEGRYKKVLNIGGNKNSEIYTVKASGLPLIQTTSEHPFYVKSVSNKRIWDKVNGTSKRMFSEPVWKETKDLVKGDFLAIPILKTESNPLNITKEEAYIIGRYIADGHTRKDYRNSENRPNDRHWQLILSVGHQKLEDFTSRINQKFSNYPHSESTNRVVFSSKRLVEIVEEHCGCGAKNKFISKTLLDLPNDLLSELLEGYLSGDGCKIGEFYSMTTISERLAQSLILAIAKVYKVAVQYSFIKVKPTTVIQGRTVNQSDSYLIKFSKEVKKQSHFLTDDNFVWVPLKLMTKTDYKQDVFNLEVEDDNSYVANNCVVHNCQSFSFSGKRNGMSTKDNVEVLTLEHYLELKSEKYEFDGQSYLFWEFIRLREEIKPKYYLLENVEMGEKWEKVLSKAVGVNGIHINSALVSAQSRKRIYWINFGMRPMGLFGDMQSIVEQPKDRGILLKDILEEEVDEKYFLSEKAVKGILKHKEEQKEKGFGFGAVIKTEDEKMNSLKVGGKGVDDLVVHNTLPRSSKTGKGGTGPLKRVDGKTYCLDTGRTNVVEFPAIFDDYNGRFRKDGKSCTLTLNSGSKSERNGQKVVLGDLKDRKVIQLSNNNKSNGGTQPYQQDRIYDVDGISPALSAHKADLIISLKSKDKRLKKMIENSDLVDGEVVHLDTYNQTLDREKTPTLRTGGKNDSFVYAPTLSKEDVKVKGDDEFFEPSKRINENLILEGNLRGGKWENTHETSRRVYNSDGKAPTVPTMQGGNQHPKAFHHSRIRRLTPLECMRLQTVADDYKMPVSSSQAYKMLGNGWNIETIVHLFNYITLEK